VAGGFVLRSKRCGSLPRHPSAAIARDDIGAGIGYEFSAAPRAPQGISGKSNVYRDLRLGLRGRPMRFAAPMISLSAWRLGPKGSRHPDQSGTTAATELRDGEGCSVR
jgi:hypothetical protein